MKLLDKILQELTVREMLEMLPAKQVTEQFYNSLGKAVLMAYQQGQPIDVAVNKELIKHVDMNKLLREAQVIGKSPRLSIAQSVADSTPCVTGSTNQRC